MLADFPEVFGMNQILKKQCLKAALAPYPMIRQMIWDLSDLLKAMIVSWSAIDLR